MQRKDIKKREEKHRMKENIRKENRRINVGGEVILEPTEDEELKSYAYMEKRN
jgi:hypothetical protein